MSKASFKRAVRAGLKPGLRVKLLEDKPLEHKFNLENKDFGFGSRELARARSELYRWFARGEILAALGREVTRAEKKHPTWPTDPIHAAAILAEEASEVVKAALQVVYEGGSLAALIEELVQTGAMAVRFLENTRAYEGKARCCRVCKCTDDDCSRCVARTGSPCSWVAWDLCSACKEGD